MEDVRIAKKYINKSKNARDNGTQFTISFYEYKRIITAKKCKYTGIQLTQQIGSLPLDTDVTIDRIDNSIGYVTGNVVACCHAYKTFKSIIENPQNIMTFKMVKGALGVQEKLMGTL